MRLTDRLKKNYRNGREEKRLFEKKFHYYSIMNDFPDSDIPYKKIIEINQQLDAIPKPRGFLEETAYALGGL